MDIIQALVQKLLQPEYLGDGSPEQQAALAELRSSGILETLGQFTPVLAGTFPLDIQLPGSDLDILCRAPDFVAFSAIAQIAFGGLSDYAQRTGLINGMPTFTAKFSRNGYRYEIFAQNTPVTEQDAFLHLVAEWRLLHHSGPLLRNRIIALKYDGLKTEPAFCTALGINAEPYAFLRSIALLPVDEFAQTVRRTARHAV